jgi:peptidase E
LVSELLLLSNSRAPGQAFLEHAAAAIRSVLGGRTQILFVPFASGDPAAYADLMRKALASLGIGVRIEENDVPVLALREGAWLGVSGRQAILAGASTGRLFRRGVPPAIVPAGTDLSFLLDTTPRFDTSPWSCGP